MPEPAPKRQTVIILTALEVETRAVLRHLSDLSSESVSGTGFFRGTFENWDVAVAESGAGNVSAAAITVRACEYYRPSIALFVGVAGGVKDVAIADVVVASKVYGYESGKEKHIGLQVRPNLLNSAHALEQMARVIRQTENWHALLDKGIGHGTPSLFIGPIAAGEKVVASKRAPTARLLREHYGDTLAVEMEGRGFLEGVHINHPVQGCVIRGISDLLSGKASADRSGSQLRAADAATAVAFQILLGLTASHRDPTALSESTSYSSAINNMPLDLDDLKALARTLLELGQPPTITILFPNPPLEVRTALKAAVCIERTIVEVKGESGGRMRNAIIPLLHMEQSKHLILGPPGSGKTHALWQAAKQLLDEGEFVPLFLPAGQMSLWDDLSFLICEAAPTLSLEKILRDPRVCLLIDGWSEFASGGQVVEKQKALRALRNMRVIANGKVVDLSDTPFSCWSLDLLSPQQVTSMLNMAQPGKPAPSDVVIDLLRLPLLLSIHILSNATSSGTGELLRRLHDHLARDLPEGFTAILAGAVAESMLSNDRAYGRLIMSLQIRAASKSINEPTQLLRRLGTIVDRNGQALPIHDLYWSWLAGCGLMASKLNDAVIDNLNTRESYRLAAQSGSRPPEPDVAAAVDDDLILAATLNASLRSIRPNSSFSRGVDQALSDSRLSVRSRGGLAALESGKSAYLKGALETMSALSSAKLYIPAWREAIQPQIIFPQRAIVADWIGADGSELVLDAIAERGGPEWAPWLEQMDTAGKITKLEALSAALGCTGEVPAWGKQYLDELFKVGSWKMRAATARRVNLALAQYIGLNYERLIDEVIPRNSSGWIDLNRALVGCADEMVFSSLLARFSCMSNYVQEKLGYAVVERGQPWIAAFQQVAFTQPGERSHHRLSDIVSSMIDDSTARTWIDAGYYEEGWRVLIARHGEGVIPELISNLPDSFSNIDHIASLSVMRFLEQAPALLPGELLKRLGSPMQPKTMQDVLNAMATAYPTGVPEIVRFVSQQPGALPAYHIAQTLQLYWRWYVKSGTHIMVKSIAGEVTTFPNWIARYSALHGWDDHFTPEMLSTLSELGAELLLTHLRDDLEKSVAVLNASKNMIYNADLVNHMLSFPKLAALIPNVFAREFDTFPVTALYNCIMSPYIDQDILLWRLSVTSNPLHRSVHKELIKRILSSPINLHHNRYVASMLRAHTVEDTDFLLHNTEEEGRDPWLWLVREVEAARGERLLNEAGRFRRKLAS